MPAKTPAEKCDSLLRLLCHHYRRQTIRFLAGQQNNATTIDELVDQMNCSSDDELLFVEMEHLHLPKLDNSDLIEWDPRSEAIRYYPDSLCEQLLEAMERHDVESPNA